MVSTNTKLDKYSSIACLAVFGRAFAVLISFQNTLCCRFRGRPYLDQFETLERISDILPLKIPSSLAIACLLIFLAIFPIFILISLEKYRHDFRCENFHNITEKICPFKVKYLHISGGIFFCFKTLYLDWFMWSVRKLLHHHFCGWFHISPSQSGPLRQNMMIRYGNDSNRVNL